MKMVTVQSVDQGDGVSGPPTELLLKMPVEIY